MTISTYARLLILACSLVAGRVALGQTFGSIDGEARDASGAPVAGVAVSATNKNTNAVRNVITNDAGVYSFPSLAPGTYTLRAEKPGFKTVVRNEIELQVQQAARIDIELQDGQVNESIEVQGEAGALATDNATVGTVIENRRIVELPLNGRNYLQLVSFGAERIHRIRGTGTGNRPAGWDSCGPNDLRRGPTHQFQSLHVGRGREHGPEFQYVRGFALD